MYIIQYLICVVQACVILEREPYVMYSDMQSCEMAASVGMKELVSLLDDKGVKVVVAGCVDKSNSIV